MRALSARFVLAPPVPRPLAGASFPQADRLLTARLFSSADGPATEGGAAEGVEAPDDDGANPEAATAGAEAEAQAEAEDPQAVRIAELEAEAVALKDQALRALADAENARTIARRDVDNAKQFAVTKFAKSLLDVSDYLSMAIASVPAEELDGNPQVKTLMEGVVMTEAALIKAFNQNGLTRYGEVGDKFDPNLHDALFEVPSADQEPGTLGMVQRRGFSLHGRVIRPAQVGTVKSA